MASKGAKVLNITVSKEQRNAINNYCVSNIGSREAILRDIILRHIEAEGFPRELSEEVLLRKKERDPNRVKVQ